MCPYTGFTLCAIQTCARGRMSVTLKSLTALPLTSRMVELLLNPPFFGNPAKLLHKTNWCVHKAQISCTYRKKFLILILQFFLEVARIFSPFSREGHSLELPFSSNAAKGTETVLTITFSEELQGFFWLPPGVPHIVS